MEEMNNEVMETENEVMDTENSNEEIYETEGSGIGKVLVAGAIAGGVALGAVAIVKSRGVLDRWMKKHLEKKGYVVEDPEVEHVECEVVDDSEETK